MSDPTPASRDSADDTLPTDAFTDEVKADAAEAAARAERTGDSPRGDGRASAGPSGDAEPAPEPGPGPGGDAEPGGEAEPGPGPGGGAEPGPASDGGAAEDIPYAPDAAEQGATEPPD